jgi:Phospholipase_D-nuclease N-terminal
MIYSIISLLMFVFIIWMLIDCIQNKSLDSTMKLVWILVILFLPVIGSLIYYFVGRGKA